MNRTVLLIGPSHLFAALMSEISGVDHVGITELTIADTTYRLVEAAHEVPCYLDPDTTSWRVMAPRFEPWLYGAAQRRAAGFYGHDGSRLAFIDRGTSKSGRTRVWTIHSWRDGARLGRIAWYAPWRRYTFQPADRTVFDRSCLDEISIFIAWKMSTRKAGA